MIRNIFLNADKLQLSPTILAGYYKFGSQTLLLGDYGVTGGAIMVEYE